MMTGTTMMQEWCVANWGSQGHVSIRESVDSLCRDGAIIPINFNVYTMAYRNWANHPF